MRPAASISLDEIDEHWPLIRFLLDDPVYQAEYAANIADFIQNGFDPETITARYEELAELIRPYVVGPNGEIESHTHLASDQAFDQALAALDEHAWQRYEAASSYLENLR